MSGGEFDYKQYVLDDIADQIERLIKNNNVPNEYGYCRDFNKETLEEFKATMAALRITAVAVQRIDWLVSGDDSEETFHKRLLEDIQKTCKRLNESVDSQKE